MSILITGYGRAGKDTFCEILRDKFGMTFTSSSWFMANEFIFDELKESRGYKTVEDCYNDRHSEGSRELWYNMISDYNKDDPTKLARKILEVNDIYCGMRSKRELDACVESGVFDLTVWIDAEARCGITETKESITVSKHDCDIIIYNNGTEKTLKLRPVNSIINCRG